MASLRKRTWKTKKGETVRWELSYMVDGIQYKKTFKKKPTPQEMAEVTQTVTQNPTIKEWVREYLDNHCKMHCKESTLETYENYYKVAVTGLYRYHIKNFKRRDIEKFIIELKYKKAPKTVNNLLVFIKAFLNYAVENKIISENPAAKIKQIPLRKDSVKSLSDEGGRCFLEVLEEKPLWINAFFSLLFYTGMRISENIALEWKDFDFENNTIDVNKQFYRYRVTPTKNYETRIIEMPEPLKEILLRYKASIQNTDYLVFLSAEEKHISVNNMRERHFRKIIEEVEERLDIDLSDVTPHCLRHTHATYLLSNGIPLIYVSKRLGHKDCKTTLNIYNHVLQSDNSKALELLNKIKQSENRAKKLKTQ